MRPMMLVLLVAAMAVLLAGCPQPQTSTSQPPAPERQAPTPPGSGQSLKIAMIAKSSTNPVFLSARTGAEAAARELSAKHGINITIDWRTPPTEDGQVQAQRLTQEMGVNLAGVDLVLKLLDQIAELQTQIERLKYERDHGPLQLNPAPERHRIEIQVEEAKHQG